MHVLPQQRRRFKLFALVSYWYCMKNRRIILIFVIITRVRTWTLGETTLIIFSDLPTMDLLQHHQCFREPCWFWSVPIQGVVLPSSRSPSEMTCIPLQWVSQTRYLSSRYGHSCHRRVRHVHLPRYTLVRLKNRVRKVLHSNWHSVCNYHKDRAWMPVSRKTQRNCWRDFPKDRFPGCAVPWSCGGWHQTNSTRSRRIPSNRPRLLKTH